MQVGHVVRLGRPLRRKHDGEIRRARGVQRRVEIAPVDPIDLHPRQRLAQCVERRGGVIGDPRERRRSAGRQRNLHRRPADRPHLAGPAARQHADIGIAADHDDPLCGARDRQEVALILQQHDARLGGTLRDQRMRGVIGRHGACGHRPVERARLDQAGQIARDHVVQPRLGDTALCHRLSQRRAEIDRLVEFLARFLVEPRIGRLHGRMHRAPIAHHPAGIVPVALQHIGQQVLVLARPVAVDLVVRAHDRSGMPLFDRDLKGEQVAHAQRRLADPRIDHHAAGFLRVEREMLDRRNDVVRLDPGDMRAAQRAREQRILAQIFEVATVPRIARQIDAARQQHVEPLVPRLRPDHRAARLCDRGIEARRRGEAGGQRGGNVALALFHLIGDAERRVAFAHQRHTEARDAVDMAGGGDEFVRRLARCHRREQAVDQRDLFRLRHPRDDPVGTGTGRRRPACFVVRRGLRSRRSRLCRLRLRLCGHARCDQRDRRQPAGHPCLRHRHPPEYPILAACVAFLPACPENVHNCGSPTSDTS